MDTHSFPVPASARVKGAYVYRNFPITFARPALWSIEGHDTRKGAMGVLEWCESEQDAIAVLAEMSEDPALKELRIKKQTDS